MFNGLLEHVNFSDFKFQRGDRKNLVSLMGSRIIISMGNNFLIIVFGIFLRLNFWPVGN